MNIKFVMMVRRFLRFSTKMSKSLIFSKVAIFKSNLTDRKKYKIVFPDRQLSCLKALDITPMH